MSCPHHDGAHACPACQKGTATDGLGFPHRLECDKGVLVLRRCASCGELVAHEQWDLAAWRCAACVPRVA